MSYIGNTPTDKLVTSSDLDPAMTFSVANITGTKAQFSTACTDGNFLYVGDVSSGIPTVVVDSTNSTITASVGNHYILTKGSAQTVNLPSTHAAGDMVWVTVANGLLTNTIVPYSGEKINNVAETMTIDSAYGSVQLRYIDGTSQWRII